MIVKNLFAIKSNNLFSYIFIGCDFDFPVFKILALYIKMSYTMPLVIWK